MPMDFTVDEFFEVGKVFKTLLIWFKVMVFKVDTSKQHHLDKGDLKKKFTGNKVKFYC